MAVDYQRLSKQSNQRAREYIRLLKELYQTANTDLVRVSNLVPFNPDTVFRFSQSPLSQTQANRIIYTLISSIIELMINATNREREAANELILDIIGELPQAIRDYVNLDALGIIQINENKIRDYVLTYLPAVEVAIDSGRRNGLDNIKISGQLNYALTKPMPLLNRAETMIEDNGINVALGAAFLLQNSRLINPGQGIYRSSFSNIKRLLLDQSHYAKQEVLDIQQKRIPVIVGYRVFTSGLSNVCPTCLALAGNYPISFIWKKWHIRCACEREFIFKTDSEIQEDVNRIEQGLQPLSIETSVNYVPEPSPKWYSYLDENQGPLSRSYLRGKGPDWFTENSEFISLEDFVNID